MTDKRTAIALGRRFGASPAAREQMAAENAKLFWIGRCRFCRAIFKGTPKELETLMAAHRCRELKDGK